ncbi:hypothetical protein BT69DRAFT_516951 [Atractiella rhizophila]|nr:hypothetical protein BT69DRAFT_516951 [Atractiella rhizophila]
MNGGIAPKMYYYDEEEEPQDLTERRGRRAMEQRIESQGKYKEAEYFQQRSKGGKKFKQDVAYSLTPSDSISNVASVASGSSGGSRKRSNTLDYSLDPPLSRSPPPANHRYRREENYSYSIMEEDEDFYSAHSRRENTKQPKISYRDSLTPPHSPKGISNALRSYNSQGSLRPTPENRAPFDYHIRAYTPQNRYTPDDDSPGSSTSTFSLTNHPYSAFAASVATHRSASNDTLLEIPPRRQSLLSPPNQTPNHSPGSSFSGWADLGKQFPGVPGVVAIVEPELREPWKDETPKKAKRGWLKRKEPNDDAKFAARPQGKWNAKAGNFLDWD